MVSAPSLLVSLGDQSRRFRFLARHPLGPTEVPATGEQHGDDPQHGQRAPYPRTANFGVLGGCPLPSGVVHRMKEPVLLQRAEDPVHIFAFRPR